MQVTSRLAITPTRRTSRLGNKSKTSSKRGEVVAKPPLSPRSRLRGPSLINDNYCVNFVTGQMNSVCVTGQGDLDPVPVANAHIVTGLPQRKGVNPTFCQMYTEIKYVKNVSCVGHLRSVKLVTNAQHAVLDPPVGARLNQCWEKWETLGSSPKVVNILREAYTLLFWFRPHLTRSPTVISNYHNPTKQSFLLEALYQLINKNAVEPVENQNSLGFYNRLFLVPKPNNRWRPILDLSTLNTFLNTGSFKMETPETIRTSLQAGEWVTSIDFKDAYFHIPIHSQSRKYMRFHQGRSYQFKALPFGLSTAPTEFTVVAKEVKLMALQKGIRIHQYLDDWLVRASTHDTCLQHTQSLVTLCQELGWLVNREKSELVPQQVFNFVGYQFDLKEGRVRPTEERWQTLTDKIRSILSWCTRQQVTLRARHIPGRLNVIADKLSRLGPTIQTEWSLHPEVFQAVCSRWHLPQVDLFATRFNNKLPQFVSPVPDPQAWAVDALSLSWEDLDPYAFPPAAILGKVVEKLQDYPCNRIILIAPGWPNMPWTW